MARISKIPAGTKYNMLTLVKHIEGLPCREALFLCDCGVLKQINFANVMRGKSKSCGCYNKSIVKKRFRTHGLTETAEYRSWCGMKTRCLNPNNPDYKDYGARGIAVCDRWMHSFDNFLFDMGNRPYKNMSIDRINVDGDYSPENCRWATSKQQACNKTNNRVIEYKGMSKVLSDWARYFGAHPTNLSNSISRKGFDKVYKFYLKKHKTLPANKYGEEAVAEMELQKRKINKLEIQQLKVVIEHYSN